MSKDDGWLEQRIICTLLLVLLLGFQVGDLIWVFFGTAVFDNCCTSFF